MAKKQPECPPGAPGWLATFSDLMTLLLTFFVLLLSFSTTEVADFRSAMQSLQGALGVSSSMMTMTPSDPEIVFDVSGGQATDQAEATIEEIIEQVGALAEIVDSLELEDKIEFEIKDDGILVRVSSETLFRSGNAKIDTTLYPVLYEIGKIAEKAKDNVFVDGHTDNMPIASSQYPSNWELSGARAASVVRFFINRNKIEPDRLFLRGFAEYAPREKNDTRKNREKNRRVEIYIKKAFGNDKDSKS